MEIIISRYHLVRHLQYNRYTTYELSTEGTNAFIILHGEEESLRFELIEPVSAGELPALRQTLELYRRRRG